MSDELVPPVGDLQNVFLEESETCLREIRRLRVPGLILLKGHLLVETMLRTIVADSLGYELPDRGFDFWHVMTLAFPAKNDERVHAIRKYNILRNTLAHKFNALDSDEFARDVQKNFQMPWPADELDRAVILQVLTFEVFAISLRRWVEVIRVQVGPRPEMFTFERQDRDIDAAAEFADRLVAHVAEARMFASRGELDIVRQSVKPGWRDRAYEKEESE